MSTKVNVNKGQCQQRSMSTKVNDANNTNISVSRAVLEYSGHSGGTTMPTMPTMTTLVLEYSGHSGRHSYNNTS
ncbi:hypothetical protein INT47_005715 [Mucor saturninus]|uniref:Uncharacterized protein n=1 Tax=Mucor saturninus TaxID=64648 RepID=A0A8H7QDM3_9FUNG|nr:hypothetical protein INT47_005715 [Mucor saturninus]